VSGAARGGSAMADYLFFDVDDTLYVNGGRTRRKMDTAVSAYLQALGLGKAYGDELYNEYGTTVKGLVERGHLTGEQVEDYLTAVHDIDLSDVKKDPQLHGMLNKLKANKKMWVFTASTKEHVQRVLRRIGIEDDFDGIVDCRATQFHTKHSSQAFELAMQKAGATERKTCWLFDNESENIRAAKHAQWQTCFIGEDGPTEADYSLRSVLEIDTALPFLFDSS